MDRDEQVQKLQEAGEFDLAMALQMLPERDLLVVVEDYSFDWDLLDSIGLEYEKVGAGDERLTTDSWKMVESTPAPAGTSDP